MSDLYLIAHRVRGEPAFDMASRMVCPICSGQGYRLNDHDEEVICGECDREGYWWIIPTSGHRAYAYAHWEFYDLMVGDTIDGYVGINAVLPIMPLDWPDHYPLRHTPSAPRIDILSLLAPGPRPTIRRRL